jgi:DMSO/TMAO reductase YedYZ heme-binding membrane subunit
MSFTKPDCLFEYQNAKFHGRRGMGLTTVIFALPHGYIYGTRIH